MINKRTKKISGFIPTPNSHQKINLVGGFTLVETMVAVFILTLIITSLMTVVANSLFAARYARDEITVNYLLQEVIDYVRNDRDTTVFLQDGPTEDPWIEFQKKYQTCLNSDRGCYFNVLDKIINVNDIQECGLEPVSGGISLCPPLYYNSKNEKDSIYTYNENDGNIITKFRREIFFKVIPPDEVRVTVKVLWKNGNSVKSRSLETSLTRWQQ